MKLEGSPTEHALRQAFRDEAEMAARLGYFARRADVDGYAALASTLRALAEGELAHAYGHLEFLEEVDGDADTAASVAALTDQKRQASTVDYPGRASTARADGFADAADWFDSVTAAEGLHVVELSRAIDRLKEG